MFPLASGNHHILIQPEIQMRYIRSDLSTIMLQYVFKTTMENKTRIKSWSLLILSLTLYLVRMTDGFVPCNLSTKSLPTMLFSLNENENADNDEPVVGRPISRMTNYAAQFLDKTASETTQAIDNDNIKMKILEELTEATHLIAIPLESSHELLIELESVQRAILHHCPILLDACIGGTTTRLPLLYIKAPESKLSYNPQNSARVTTALAGTVQRLVKKHIYGAARKKISNDNDNESSDDNDDSLNAEGYRPLTMTFQSLEIDGDNNNILNTVGSFCSYGGEEEDHEHQEENDDEKILNYNEKRFRNFIRDLKCAIAAQGWEMAFPPDPNRAERDLFETTAQFRPRVAFMELPKKFDENIRRFKDKDIEIQEEDMKFLMAEEGGNGISPIFWCNWWDDVFARNVRLQEIGIYPTNPMIVDSDDTILEKNSQFYLPFETIALPNGNEEMIESEKKFLDYHNKRIEEKEEEFRKENFKSQNSESPKAPENPISPGSLESSEPDVLMTKTRKRLEGIYLKDSGFEDSTALLQELEEGSQINDDKDDKELLAAKDSTRSRDDDYIEDWMRQRILKASNTDKSLKSNHDINNPSDALPTNSDSVQEGIDTTASRIEEKIKSAVNSLGSVNKNQAAEKEPKYSIEDNPVFKAHKKGTLAYVKHDAKATKKLGPYPGNDHFVGIWNVVVNPVGDIENTNTEGGSENLILRVDGTTAAGPTLNPETNQKAAGGTWKILPQKNGEVLLRIRLVIPPDKNRILVMEGLVTRGMQPGINMASRTFGIPEVERRAMKDASIACSGESYIEDAVTKKNKIRAENFYIEKVRGKDPDDYTVIIPKTIRRLD